MTETAKRPLAGIRELAPDITACAAEIETGRRIPRDPVDALRAIGVFRMVVPQSHGGLELELPTALEIIAALGRIVAYLRAGRSDREIFEDYPTLPRDGVEAVIRWAEETYGPERRSESETSCGP